MKTYANSEGNIIFVRLDDGEDFFDGLTKALKEQGVQAGVIIGAIGMLRNFEIGWFNTSTMQYEKEFISQPHELTSVQGNISKKDGEIFIHAHITLAGASRTIVGGHLFKAEVCNTAEIFVEKLDINLVRKQAQGFRPLEVE